MKSKIEDGVLTYADPADIEGGVFQCDAVIEVGREAFAACRDLLNEVILNNATKLHPEALLRCSKLNKCKFPKVKEVGSYALGHCSGLEELDLPNATNIAPDAFLYTQIKKLFIPKGTLGQDHFQMFKELDTLYVHRLAIVNVNLQKLRLVVFFGATTIDDKKEIYSMFNRYPDTRIMFGTEFIQKIMILMMLVDMLPQDIVGLILSQFLKENSTEESIIEDGFLLRVGKADINGGVFKNTKVTSVGDAFNNRNDIKEIVLPNAIEFGDYAFFRCSVEKVTAENLQKAGQDSLNFLINSTEIELPNLESVNEGLFMDFCRMRTCKLPKVTYLPRLALNHCYNLETLILHRSVRLHPFALYECENIRKIILHGEATAEDRIRLIQQLPEIYKNVTIGSTIAPALPPRKKAEAPQIPVAAKTQESIEKDQLLTRGSQQVKSSCEQGLFKSDKKATREIKTEGEVVFAPGSPK